MEIIHVITRDIYFYHKVNILSNWNKTAQIHHNKQKYEDGFLANVTHKRRQQLLELIIVNTHSILGECHFRID